MSRSSSAAALVLGLASAAQAGVEPAEGPERGRDASVLSAASAARGTSARSSFRCWQEGKLIYEAPPGVQAPRLQAAVELRARGDGSVRVIDLRHGLCILESPLAPTGE